ncbi:substrate-binding domain-containing protein [Sorangium sp. So ce1335]|uniref:substrate-binding domain-containing protein n=1 Tax=Sorangium sp. So ce1335 TaxID=3133335 RepID=UPI003F63F10F
MLKVPDLLAVLQQIVRRAMAISPRAPRGALLLRDDHRFALRALIGADGPRERAPYMPAAGALAGGGAPLAPAAAPDAARGICVVAARAWYGAFLPAPIEVSGGVPEGAGVLVAPIHARGEPVGYLAVEQPTLEPPGEERRAMIEVIADAAGDALERNRLHDDKARSAQEIRLFERLLGAVGTTVELHDLIETIAHGIKSVQLDEDWKTVELWALEDDSPPGAAAPARGSRRARVYRAPPSEPTTYWQNIRAGAVSAGRPLGIAVDFRTGDGGGGEGSQRALLDEAIRRRVSGILIAPSNPEDAEEAFRQAAEAGIPVVVIDTPPVAGSRAQLYIGTDNVASGRLAAAMMKRLLPGGGVVAALGAVDLARNVGERVEGFRAEMLGSSVTVLPTVACDWGLAAGTRLATAALGARTDIAGAFGAAADNGPCWGLSAKALGRSGDLKIVGFDLIASTVALLRQGTIHATIVQREHDMGFRGVEVLHRMITRGISSTLAELPPSRVLHTDVDCVTLEPTPWSTALGDYLTREAARRVDTEQGGVSPSAGDPAEIMLIGFPPPSRSVIEDEVSIAARSLVGRALDAGSPLVIDPDEGDGRAEAALPAAHAGARTVVVLPLRARGNVLGALVLSSERREACGRDDVSFLVRVASTVAVGVENARLFRRISERSAELERANQQQASLLQTIRELSSPVVPIADGILVMPVVGVMDAERSSHFIASMLREIDAQRARVVLIDVTGMATVDAAAASQLAQAAQAAGLLGAEAVLVGLRPGAARMMVDQGLDLGAMVTRSDLANGFRYALARTRGRAERRG